MKHRFYDPAMHGVDWAKVRDTYETAAGPRRRSGGSARCHQHDDRRIERFAHRHQCRRPRRRSRDSGSDQTRYPGFELEADPSGFYKVVHIYKDGPADKDYVNINAGDFILAIDGQDIKAGDNYWKLYTTAPGDRMEFLVNKKPVKEGAWSAKVRPVSSVPVRQPPVRTLGRRPRASSWTNCPAARSVICTSGR